YHPRPLLRALSNWLDDHANSRFFAYVHFLPPHYPYRQPSEMTELFAGLEPVNFEPGDLPFPERVPPAFPTPPPLPEWINLYDANLRWGDWAVGEVEALLRERGILDSTLLIVTADHGEGFGEHRHPWHGRSVYDEVCHIPLIIKFPGNALAGKRFGTLTESVDLLPTIFDLLRIPHPTKEIQGQSLLPLLAGVGGSPAPHVYSRAGGSPSKYLLRSKDHALILYNNGQWRALYDLRADPTQKNNVAADKAEVMAEMVEVFRRFAQTQRRPPMDFFDPDAEMPGLPEVPEIEMSPEDRARVNAIADLGYLR
ncbi:MAG: sulfatase-like hydrolase/transferase, partial [Armatimonadota bacterium]